MLLLTVLLTIVGCNGPSEREKEIAATEVQLEIERFDRVFAGAGPADLPELKASYPVFFPEHFHDSIWKRRMGDSLQQQLEEATYNIFPDDSYLEDELYPLFQHTKYYFPEFREPVVYTTTSDVDYRNKVIYADSLLILSLDTFLGQNHEFYLGIKRYLAKNMSRERIAPEVASAIAKTKVPPPQKSDLLSLMVYYGKILYVQDLLLPEVTDARKIGYTEDELQWAQENEVDIWRYLIEKELLYSTDPKLAPRLIRPAPFSKFYLAIDNESPGMIGRFVGWQIVRSFARNNDLSLKELLRIPADRLYKESKYKPNR